MKTGLMMYGEWPNISYRPYLEEIAAYILNKSVEEVAGSDFVKQSELIEED